MWYITVFYSNSFRDKYFSWKSNFFRNRLENFKTFPNSQKKIWRLIIVGFHCFHKFFILSQKQMWWTCNIMPKIYSFINRMNYWAKKNEEIRILKKFFKNINVFVQNLTKFFRKISNFPKLFRNAYSGFLKNIYPCFNVEYFWKSWSLLNGETF